jgi:hypothetical protein
MTRVYLWLLDVFLNSCAHTVTLYEHVWFLQYILFVIKGSWLGYMLE